MTTISRRTSPLVRLPSAPTGPNSSFATPLANTGFAFADFLLGLADNYGSFVNQTEGVAQVPAQVAGKQTYRALYANDTWRVTPKLTISAGLRYELQGPWSERFNNLTYWNPNAVNGAVTGCNGTAGVALHWRCFLCPDRSKRQPQQYSAGQAAVVPQNRFGL